VETEKGLVMGFALPLARDACTLHLILGHGSRDASANLAFERWVSGYRGIADDAVDVAHAYVELASPSLEQALLSLGESYPRVVVVPAVLFAAGHIKNDVPLALDAARVRAPRVAFSAARPLGVDARLADVIAARVCDALGADEPAQTAVLVVGRGSSDADANGDFTKLVRLFAERQPYLRVEACFAGVTTPNVETSLAWLARARPARIVVVPYLLFAGRILDKLQTALAAFASTTPWIATRLSAPLGDDPRLLAVAYERAQSALAGRDPMPCDTCQYRTPVGAVRDQVGGLRSLLWSVRHMETHTQAMPHTHAHAPLQKHVFVCTNKDCAERGSVGLVSALRRKLKSLGQDRSIRVTRSACMGRCGEGPALVVYPDGVFYRGVAESDAAQLVDDHLLRNRLVGRLVDSILP
jgi:sirohydrochlorin ferrochelatase/(2Fe-2S) ferredoxin